MPAEDVVESFGEELGSVNVMKSKTDSTLIIWMRFMKTKYVIASVGSTSMESQCPDVSMNECIRSFDLWLLMSMKRISRYREQSP